MNEYKLDQFEVYQETANQTYIIVKNNNDFRILKCDSCSIHTEMEYGAQTRVICECKDTEKISHLPEDIQYKLLDCIEKETLEKHRDDKRNLEMTLDSIKKEIEYYRNDMKSTYKMLEEFTKWAEKLESVNPNLFKVWIEIQHFMKSKSEL